MTQELSLDLQITLCLQADFVTLCERELMQKEAEGKGFFLTADPELLQDKLRQHTENGNFVAAANYCMMLHQLRRHEDEEAHFSSGIKQTFLER